MIPEKLKIAVIQPGLSRIGGHLQTTMAFADTFKEIGSEVRVFATFEDANLAASARLVPELDAIPEFYNLSNLELNDFSWSLDKETIETFAPDLLFFAGRYFDYSRELDAKKVAWMVGVNDERRLGDVDEMWTNSPVTQMIFARKPEVVVAPHDYSAFRAAWQDEKDYDVIGVMRSDFSDTGKGLELYAKCVKSLGLKGLLVTTIESDEKRQRIDSLGIPYVSNVTRAEVARLMGKSRILFLGSYAESCPLVIYEALSAGLLPVARDVGAISWQIGSHGYLFKHDDEAEAVLKKACASTFNHKSITDYSLKYDRCEIKKTIASRLTSIFS